MALCDQKRITKICSSGSGQNNDPSKILGLGHKIEGYVPDISSFSNLFEYESLGPHLHPGIHTTCTSTYYTSYLAIYYTEKLLAALHCSAAGAVL